LGATDFLVKIGILFRHQCRSFMIDMLFGRHGAARFGGDCRVIW